MKIAFVPGRPAANRLAALFYAFAAVSWYMVLFTATPPRLTPVEAAASFLRDVFSRENPDRWWFLLWAALPVLLLALAAAHLVWHASGRGEPRLSFSIGVTIGVASPLLWPSLTIPVLAALLYAYLGVRTPEKLLKPET